MQISFFCCFYLAQAMASLEALPELPSILSSCFFLIPFVGLSVCCASLNHFGFYRFDAFELHSFLFLACFLTLRAGDRWMLPSIICSLDTSLFPSLSIYLSLFHSFNTRLSSEIAERRECKCVFDSFFCILLYIYNMHWENCVYVKCMHSAFLNWSPLTSTFNLLCNQTIYSVLQPFKA